MKAIIVGGGIGGLTAALCLAQKGVACEVFEQATDFGEIGAGIQLSPNCSRVLHAVGLEEALRAHAFLPEGTQFRDYKSGAVIAENPLGEIAEREFGSPYYHIHRGDLLRVLVEACEAKPEISLATNARIETFNQDTDGVTGTVNGQAFAGDLLLGADGIHSAVRGQLWGPTAPTFTGNVAWRAMVPTASLPEGLIRPMSTAWWGPGKHFVHYYVRRGEFVNCVCVVEKTGWEVESWTQQGDYAELKSDFEGWHADIHTLIDNADRGSLFKWALHDRPPMSAWGKGRVTLLGDACHPTLPFMAQGAAMAIEDAAVLALCLEADNNVSAALQNYEDLRRERTARIQRGSRRNATVFHMSGVKAWLRNRAAKRAGASSMAGLFGYNALEVLN